MGKIIYPINLSIDGYCDHTIYLEDAATFDYYIQLIRQAELLIYGRITYQLMIPYWPDVAKNPSADKAQKAFADAFDITDKVVFSKTIQEVDNRTRIFRTNLKEEVLKLKQEHIGDILVGGVSLPAQLTELGLIDEFRFLVLPVIVGHGRRLFDGINLPQNLRLKFIDKTTLGDGFVMLRYRQHHHIA